MKMIKQVLAISLTLISFQLSAAEGVARATFTTDIDNREPVNEISNLDNEASKVYYFTELKGLKGQTISHRWEQNGEVQATVRFDVGGDRWRVWSSKNLQPEFTGEWQVMVIDEAGNVLSQNAFNYGDKDNATTTEQSISGTDSEAANTLPAAIATGNASEKMQTEAASMKSKMMESGKMSSEKMAEQMQKMEAQKEQQKAAANIAAEELSKISPAAGSPAEDTE